MLNPLKSSKGKNAGVLNPPGKLPEGKRGIHESRGNNSGNAVLERCRGVSLKNTQGTRAVKGGQMFWKDAGVSNKSLGAGECVLFVTMQ